MVKRGEDFLECYGSVRWFSSLTVGRSNHLSVSHTTACHQGTSYARPVITPDFCTDLWCSTKFTPNQNGCVFVQSSVMQVVNQCRDRFVEDWEVFFFASKDAVVSPAFCIETAVPVPLAVINGDDTCPGFD